MPDILRLKGIYGCNNHSFDQYEILFYSSMKAERIVEKKLSKNLLPVLAEVQSGSTVAMEKILKIFEPIIVKYSVWLKTDDAKQDFSLFVIEKIRNYPIASFQNDASFVRYLAQSIYHEYIRLSKEQRILETKFEPLEEGILNGYTPKFEENLEVRSLLVSLSARQKNILLLKYFYGYGDEEIGSILHITRQAVNKQKSRYFKNVNLY